MSPKPNRVALGVAQARLDAGYHRLATAATALRRVTEPGQTPTPVPATVPGPNGMPDTLLALLHRACDLLADESTPTEARREVASRLRSWLP